MLISREGWVAIGAISTLVVNFLVLLAVSTREVVLIIKSGGKRRNGETAGEKSIEFWVLTFTKIFDETIKEAAITMSDAFIRIERNQVEILKLLRNVRATQRNKYVSKHNDDDDTDI